MAVPTIALYASPPSTVYEFEVSSRTPSSSATSSQKPAIGGLSCLFASPNVKYSSSSSSFIGGSDELCRGDDLKELSGSLCYSPGKICGSLLRRDQSPVSVLQCPVSSSCGSIRVRDRYGELGSVRGGVSGLFNGFVRNALGSCIDYDSPRFEVDGSSSGAVVDDLTFNMEDGFGDGDCEPYAMELLTSARSSYKVFCNEVVVKAFYEAEKAHRGQMRASGDPYLQHCVETGKLLASIGANSSVVAAGLLHDTLDDSFTSYDYIFKTFGAGVADLVEGVSKLSELSELARHNDTASKSVEADRLHTMFLAMADARAVLIKLADRLHNMKTLDALPFAKRQRFAKETLEIFAPLANRLGISSWKQQLENICFKHLNPEQHELLSSKLVESFDEAMITSAIEKLELALKNESISYHVVSGRHKSLYSIYRKMLKKKLSVDEIHDLHGLRLIVDNLEDCYGALNVVHQLWSQVPGKFKDYIAQPKFNGYQSLHTVVMDESMVPFEVQIRTKEMHLQAEFGFAAHWRYKEGDCKHSTFVLRMVEWARWVVTWQCEAMSKDCSVIGYSDSIKPPCTFPTHDDDCPYSYIPHCGQEGPVFVILIENDKMSVHEFPANSSVMDLLERAGRGSSRWSPYGFPVKEELKPRLNHKPISNPKCKLKMGDVVELTPSIPDKSLTEYREEIQRMYDRGLAVSSTSTPASSVVGWRM